MKTLIIGAIGIKPSLVAELKNKFRDAKIITTKIKKHEQKIIPNS
jgi:hypothetical protein